jgi:hypothetical protein
MKASTSFTGVQQLNDHIDVFVETYNTCAAPFAWTKPVVHQKRLKPRFSDLCFRVLGIDLVVAEFL